MKTYTKPAICVVKIQSQNALLAGSNPVAISSNVDFDPTITGGSVDARTRESNVWEEEW